MRNQEAGGQRSENRRCGRGPNDLLHNLDRLCYAAVFDGQGSRSTLGAESVMAPVVR